MTNHRPNLLQRMLHAIGMCPRGRVGYFCRGAGHCGWRR